MGCLKQKKDACQLYSSLGLPDQTLGTDVPSSKNLEPKYKAKTHGSSGTNGLVHYALYCGDAGPCYTAQDLLGLRSCNPIN